MSSLIRTGKQLIASLHRKNPPWLKKLYAPLFLWRHSELYKNFYRFRLPLTVYSGLSADGKHALKFAYAGTEQRVCAQWLDLLFNNEPDSRAIGVFWIWRLTSRLRKAHPDCAILVTEVSSRTENHFRRHGAFIVPDMVILEIDISSPLATMIRQHKGLEDAARRVRKHGLDAELTTESSRKVTFYYDMHLPFINRRYGDAAILRSDDSGLQILADSELLFVNHQGSPIAGVSINRHKTIPTLEQLGVSQAHPNPAAMGGIAAIYYFSIQTLQQQGYDRMDIGGTPAFLSNGLLRFKRSMGAGLSVIRRRDEFNLALQVLKLTDESTSILQRIPFISFDSDRRLQRNLFVTASDPLDLDTVDSLLKTTRLPGLDSTTIYCSTPPPDSVTTRFAGQPIRFLPLTSASG